MAISLNMDSLRHAVGNFPLHHDPFYFEAIDDVIRIAALYGAPITFYVIGRDLEYSEIRQRIKTFFENGHEIANHTYSHFQNFGAISQDEQREEILKCQTAIAETIGEPATGFLAPAWSSNRNLCKILAQEGFQHDSSHFSSLFVFALQFKLVLNFLAKFLMERKVPKTYSILHALHRKDFLINLRFKYKPHIQRFALQSDAIVELPLPQSRFGIPYWFTLEFFSPRFAQLVWNGILKKDLAYLLIHPADFATKDLVDAFRENQMHSLERIEQNKAMYLATFESRLREAKEAGFQFVTMSQLASQVMHENDQQRS